MRFLVDGAEVADFMAYARVVYLFDGRDAGAVEKAREQWKLDQGSGAARLPIRRQSARETARQKKALKPLAANPAQHC